MTERQAPALQPYLATIGWTPPVAGTSGPLVAVLDTGIDGTHPALREAVAIRTSRSFTTDTNPFDDSEGHGTHVAGIIAARPTDSGVVGVSGSRLLVVKVADTTGQAGTSALVRGIRYAKAAGRASSTSPSVAAGTRPPSRRPSTRRWEAACW